MVNLTCIKIKPNVTEVCLRLPYESREHPRQQLAARHATAVLPPTDPDPLRTGQTHPRVKRIQHSSTSPNNRPQRAERTNAEHRKRPKAWPTTLSPYERVLHDRVALYRDGDSRRCFGEGRGEARTEFDEQACDEDGEEERRGCCAE